METRAIPEDLMIELQKALKKNMEIAEQNQIQSELCADLAIRIASINERNQNNDYREWTMDYERSIAC